MPPDEALGPVFFLLVAGVLGSLLLFGLLLKAIFDHVTRPLKQDLERLKERVRRLETAERRQARGFQSNEPQQPDKEERTAKPGQPADAGDVTGESGAP